MALATIFNSTLIFNSPLIKAVLDPFDADAPPGIYFALFTAMMSIYLYGGCYKEKVGSWLWASLYFCMARDRGIPWQSISEDDISANESHRKVIFIRHGESEWNVVFRRPWGPGFFGALFAALFREAMLWVQKDSVILDSPLSKQGVDQALELLRQIAEMEDMGDLDWTALKSKPVKAMDRKEIVAILRGDAGDSVVVSSQLRRAVSTITMCLNTRLLRSKDQGGIQVMSVLQEVGRSPDTVSLTPKKEKPRLPLSEAGRRDAGDIFAFSYEKYIDADRNDGNKGLRSTGPQRQEEFCQWLFDPKTPEHVVVCGHGLWFRNFFEALLPTSSSHSTKKEKLKHCEVVAFDCYCKRDGDGRVRYFRVDQDSIKKVYPYPRG